MTADDILSILRRHEAELRQRGVRTAALFGSTARGEAGSASDLDIFVRFEPGAPITLWDYVSLKRRIGGMFAGVVSAIDVIDLDGMKPRARAAAERDARHAF